MSDELKPIDSQWTFEGFNSVFEKLIKQEKTYVQAYIEAEEMHVRLFGKLRYSSYDSFRLTRQKAIFGK